MAIPALAILRALRASASDRFTLMRWDEEPEWHAASNRPNEAEAREIILDDAFIHGAGDDDD